jgi:putative membrane-bound dehydrogenase-like protein
MHRCAFGASIIRPREEGSTVSLQTSAPLHEQRRPWWLALVLTLAGGWIVGPAGGARCAEKPASEAPLPFQVPAGFVAERVAGPPLVEYPMFACFDDRGRLYVVDSAGVNLLPEQLSKDPPHRIRLLEDTHGNGRFDRGTVFADRLTYPQGVLWHDGAVYAASPPSLWRFEDSKGAGVADKRRELVTGFTFTKWADDLHGPFLGPDGRIYWTSGRYPHEVRRLGGPVLVQGDGPRVLRCRPDGGEVEAFCSGIGNAVEVAFSPEGEPFAVGTFALQGAERDALMHCVFGGVYPIKDREVAKLAGIQHTGDPLPLLVHFGVVAPSGLVRYRSGAFGADYQDNLFSAQFGKRAIQRHVLERDGATFRARSTDFIVARIADFHPTDVLEDADGSLLIVDTGNWYSLCPSSKVGTTPVKGGIYRIRRQGAAAVTDPRGLALAWDRLKGPELARLLDDPRFAVRDRAVHQLAKQGKEALALLQEVLRTSGSVRARRNAVWTLAQIDGAEARAAVRLALADSDSSVRQTATCVAGLHRDAAALERLAELVVSKEPAIRREAATALGRTRRAAAVPALFNGLRAGGDRFLEHALIYALIDIADREATRKGLSDSSPVVRRGALIALDQMEGGQLTRELVIPLLNTSDPDLQQAALAVLTARPEWAKDAAGLLREWLAQAELPEDRQPILRGAVVAFCKDPAIQKLIAQALGQEKTPVATRLLLLEAIARTPLAKLPPAWVTALGQSLEDRDERVVRQAAATIRAAGITDADEALMRLARDPSRSADVRVAALAVAMPRLERIEPTLFTLLLSGLDKSKPPLARLAAAETLGNTRLDDAQLEALVKLMSGAGALELPHLLAPYEHARSGALGKKLVSALDRSPGLASLSPETLRRTFRAYPDEVRRAAEPLEKRLELDTEKQKTRLAELQPVLSGGDAPRGREVFFGRKASCTACHMVQGQGGRVGPDLSKIGSVRTPEDLLEAIVFPSATFARGYEPYIIATHAGQLYTGIITRETADAIYLITTERAEIRVPRSAIESVERGRVSIMPQGLDAQLSRQELSDLIAFLHALR